MRLLLLKFVRAVMTPIRVNSGERKKVNGVEGGLCLSQKVSALSIYDLHIIDLSNNNVVVKNTGYYAALNS